MAMNENEIKVHTRLTRKYLTAPESMVNVYSEDRNGHLYLVNGDGNLAILCDAIVSIEML